MNRGFSSALCSNNCFLICFKFFNIDPYFMLFPTAIARIKVSTAGNWLSSFVKKSSVNSALNTPSTTININYCYSCCCRHLSLSLSWLVVCFLDLTYTLSVIMHNMSRYWWKYFRNIFLLYRKLLFMITLQKRKNRRRMTGAVKVGRVVGGGG